jgi:hypothetical protein
MKVILTNGETRTFKSERSSEWYRGEVERDGSLTVLRVWDGGVCCGTTREAAFAAGTWSEWNSDNGS